MWKINGSNNKSKKLGLWGYLKKWTSELEITKRYISVRFWKYEKKKRSGSAKLTTIYKAVGNSLKKEYIPFFYLLNRKHYSAVYK